MVIAHVHSPSCVVSDDCDGDIGVTSDDCESEIDGDVSHVR